MNYLVLLIDYMKYKFIIRNQKGLLLLPFNIKNFNQSIKLLINYNH